MELSVEGISISTLGVGNSCASFDCIPNEIVISILSRLPVKTILLSTCVCKRWYSLIKTPAFISAHLSNPNPNPTNNFILLARQDDDHDDQKFYLYSDDNLPSLQATLKIPFQTLTKSIHIVGSCNGLLCITDYNGGYFGCDIYLINPFLHKYKKINAQGSCYPDLLSMGDMGPSIIIGFGHSDVENDYKVFRHFSTTYPVCWSKVEIYSLKTGKWNVVDDSVDLPATMHPPIVDGCLYWWNYSWGDILYFDLNCQVFRKTETPANYNIIQLSSPCTSAIFQLNGSLVLIGIVEVCETSGRFWIFMMEKEKDNCGQLLIRWKEFDYELQPDVHFGIFNYPIGFSGNGRLVFEHGDITPFSSTDTSTDDEFDVEEDVEEIIIWQRIGVANLDNLSAAQNFTLDFPGQYTITTNFTASLEFFLD